MFPYNYPNRSFYIYHARLMLSHIDDKSSNNIIFSNLPIFIDEIFYQNINIDVDKLLNNPKLLNKYRIITRHINTEM